MSKDTPITKADLEANNQKLLAGVGEISQGMASHMDKRFEQVDERFDQVESRLDRVERKLDQIIAKSMITVSVSQL